VSSSLKQGHMEALRKLWSARSGRMEPSLLREVFQDSRAPPTGRGRKKQRLAFLGPF
jgi:hypothetical protein